MSCSTNGTGWTSRLPPMTRWPAARRPWRSSFRPWRSAWRRTTCPCSKAALIVNKVAKIIGLERQRFASELEQADRSRRRRPVRSDGRTWRPCRRSIGARGCTPSAQREILEVLLNEPGLFHGVEQEITEDLFDVPVLARDRRRYCSDVIRSEEDFSLSRCSGPHGVGGDGREHRRVAAESARRRATTTPAWSMPWRCCTGSKDRSTGDVRTNERLIPRGFLGVGTGRPGRQNPHSIGMT